jgi:SET domain-containing protein
MPRVRALVTIAPSPIQGQGVFAAREIPKGTRIIEYAGERITPSEADRRYDDDTMERHHTFLFSLDRETTIDGNVDGNEARFINHCCDPNCEAMAEDGRIYILALRAIPEGAELTYDYRYARHGTTEEEARLNYPCRCGARNCRGTIIAPLADASIAKPIIKMTTKTKTKTKKTKKTRARSR